MSPYDKEPLACEGCEKLQQELNEMEERLDRERRYGYDVRTELTRLQQHVRELELLHAQTGQPAEDCEMTQTTHWDDCWKSGPEHYECAVAEVDRLQLAYDDQHSVASLMHQQAEKAEAEVERLREAIEAAPHDPCCNAHVFDKLNKRFFPCNCWQRTARGES